MMSMPVLSIVVPCYNEEGNIPLIVKRFSEVLKGRSDVEVVLVNNGSTDQSAVVFEREIQPDSVIRVVNVVKNQGYGYGILAGLQAARGSVMAWTHADMQTDPADVLVAFSAFQKENDPEVFVKGNRKQRALIPAFFTWGMGFLASVVLRQKLKDIGAQPKLFSREFYERHLANGAPHDFSLDLYAQYWAERAGRIITVPVYFGKRQHGEAKGGGSLKTRLKVTMRVARYIFKLRDEIRQQENKQTYAEHV